MIIDVCSEKVIGACIVSEKWWTKLVWHKFKRVGVGELVTVSIDALLKNIALKRMTVMGW